MIRLENGQISATSSSTFRFLEDPLSFTTIDAFFATDLERFLKLSLATNSVALFELKK